MAKGSRSGGFSSGRSSSSSYRVAPAPIPKVHNNIFSAPKKMEVPPLAQTVSSKSTLSAPVSSASSSGGFLSTMAEGFSFGVGSSVARNVVDRIFSPSTTVNSSGSMIHSSKVGSNHICTDLEKSWKECMSMNNQDLNICKQAFEDYEACKRNV
jgi:hypothetical protein